MRGAPLKTFTSFAAAVVLASATLTSPALAQNNGQGNGQNNGQGSGQNNGQGGGQNNAQPNCELVVESGPDQWIINYDPFVDTGAVRQFDLVLHNRGSGPCTGVIGVELRGETFGLAQPGGATRLPYTLVDERGGGDLTPRSGESARRISSRPVNLGPNDREILRFSFAINSTDLLSAGLYSQNAFITVDHPNGRPWTEKPVTLGVRIPSAAMMGLKGEFQRVAGLATIDLGRLTEGSRSLNTTLYVLSTSSYVVSVSSANAGRLRQGMTDWYVPYGLAVGDRRIDLTRPSRLEITSTRPRADDYPLAVDIGSLAGRRAGEYSDVVTFTVAAL